MFRVRVDNGLTQRNAEDGGGGGEEEGRWRWVVIRGLVGRAKRGGKEGEDGKHAVCKLCKR